MIKTEESQEIAASKAGMDAKTARKYRRLERLPSELPSAVRGRTTVVNGISLVNFDGFAPASQWEELTTAIPIPPSGNVKGSRKQRAS